MATVFEMKLFKIISFCFLSCHRRGPDFQAVVAAADALRRAVCGDMVTYVVREELLRQLKYSTCCLPPTMQVTATGARLWLLSKPVLASRCLAYKGNVYGVVAVVA